MRRVCKRCGRNRAEKFYSGPRARFCTTCRKRKTAGYNKDARLQETYGITLEEYELLLQAGGGCCWICGGVRKVLDVDHCHTTEKALLAAGADAKTAARSSVRGLACRRCNRRLLPSCLNSVEILENAIAYLQSDLAQRLLTQASS
jgi:hypothetical protein